MLKSKRIQEIKTYVAERQVVSLDELAEHFSVSKNTIRRDIQELVESGEIKKVYGGVAINDATTPLLPFSERQVRNKHEKELIGKLAAQCVNDGDIIFIDSGTTTVEMFEHLKHKEITIITSNLDFIVRALAYPNLTIICVGGMLERKTSSFVSLNEPSILLSYNIQKAFMASTGISLEIGVTNASALETEIKRTAVDRSMRTFLLVDHTKFDRYGLMTYCQLSDVDVLVTDQVPDPKYLDYARIHEIEILTPAPEPSKSR